MGWRRCSLCKTDNYRTELSVFKASDWLRRKIGDTNLKYVCENHFDKRSIIKCSGGRKRYFLPDKAKLSSIQFILGSFYSYD